MPQLGLLERVIQNTLGVAQASVSLTVYREGATVNGTQSGTSPFTVTVRDNGKIVSSDTVFINTTTGTTYNVDSTTDTTIVLSGFAGTLNLTNGDRIRASNNLPTLYSDDQGGTSTTNPPTATGTNGRVAVYTEFGAYDAIASGGSITTTGFESLVVGSEAPGQIRFADAFAVGSSTGGIQEAINDLPSAGGVVQLSGGKTYSPTVKVTCPSGTTLAGGGIGSTIIQQPNSTNLTAMFENADTTNGNSNISFRDLTIDGNKANNTGVNTHLIRIDGGSDIRIENCELREHRGQAVRLAATASAVLRRVWIERCYVHDGAPTGVAMEGVRIDADPAQTVEDVWIRGCKFKTNNGRQHVSLRGAAADATPIRRVFIIGNSFEDTTVAPAISCELSNDVTISDNSFENVDGGAAFISNLGGTTASGKNISFTANHVRTVPGASSAANGVEQSGGGKNVVIANNTFEACNSVGKFAISAGSCDGIVVALNTIANCSSGGITARAISSDPGTGPFIVVKNEIRNVTGRGINVTTDVPNCSVEDNTVEISGDDGIRIANNSTGPLIDFVAKENRVRSATGHGLRVAGRDFGTTNGSRIRVTDNEVRDSASAGIRIDDCDVVRVDGNTCFSNNGSGIKFNAAVSSDNLHVCNNVCYDNGDTNADGDDGITFAGADHNTAYVQGNMCFETRAGAARFQNVGIEANNAAYGKFIFGPNFCRNNITVDFNIGNIPSSEMAHGSFTCAAAAATTVNCPFVNATSRILLFPTNAAAGSLQAGATSLYISAKTAGVSFAVTTANGGAAAGTETFDYVVLP